MSSRRRERERQQQQQQQQLQPPPPQACAPPTGGVLWQRQHERALRCTILALIYGLAFAVRLFSVLTHDDLTLDPYFNLRATKVLTTEGFDAFYNWLDTASWYPLARPAGASAHGLMWTAALLHQASHYLTLAIPLHDIAMFIAPFFAGNTAMLAYLLGVEAGDRRVGLLAAALMAVCPAHIARSVAGSFDNESVAIFAMLLTFLLFIKAANSGSIVCGVAAAVSYFYTVASWSGYIIIINILPLYVLTLIATGRYTVRIYTAYSVFYVLGTLLSMQMSLVGFQPVHASEHLLALATFAALQPYALLMHAKTVSMKGKPKAFAAFQTTVLRGTAACMVGAVSLAVATDAITPWTWRARSLLDPSAQQSTPIVASVSENVRLLPPHCSACIGTIHTHQWSPATRV
jgi:dolichyl-diphosphooligosaccharide--protein glycosyltransferase